MKRQTRATSLRQCGFTLIEVLVVIAIIAILAGFVFPAIQKAILTAKRNTAVSEARAIAGAIELFYRDYGWMPVPADQQGFAPGPGDGDFGDEQDKQQFDEDGSKDIIQVLTATSTDTTINPRKKTYLDVDRGTANGVLLDPWGNQYRIKLDLDYNNQLEYYSDPMQFSVRAIVVSAGKAGWRSGSDGDVPNDPTELVANVIFDPAKLK